MPRKVSLDSNNLTREILGRIVAKKSGFHYKVIDEVLLLILKEAVKGINATGELHMIGFGKFIKYYDKEVFRLGRGYYPPKWRVKFRPSQTLAEVVNHERPIPDLPQLRHPNYTSERKYHMPHLSVFTNM